MTKSLTIVLGLAAVGACSKSAPRAPNSGAADVSSIDACAADAIGDSAGAPSMEGRFSRNRWRLWLPREASCFRIGLRLSTPAHLHACSDGTLRNHAPSRSHLLAARLVTYST